MKTRTTVIGVFLILFGGLTFMGNFGLNEDWIILPFISLGFMFVYFLLGAWKKKANIGFLIPGIMTGVVGLSVILDESNIIPPEADASFLVMLGVGFLLIMFIHTMRTNSKSWGERFWPIFPGGILIMVGAIDLTTSVSKTVYGLITPVILVLIGVYLLFSQLTGSPKAVSNKQGSEQYRNLDNNKSMEGSVNLQKKNEHDQ